MRETTPPTEVEMNELCRELYYCKSAYTLMRQRMALLLPNPATATEQIFV